MTGILTLRGSFHAQQRGFLSVGTENTMCIEFQTCLSLLQWHSRPCKNVKPKKLNQPERRKNREKGQQLLRSKLDTLKLFLFSDSISFSGKYFRKYFKVIILLEGEAMSPNKNTFWLDIGRTGITIGLPDTI